MPTSVFRPKISFPSPSLFDDAVTFPDLRLDTDEAGRLTGLWFIRKPEEYPALDRPERNVAIERQLEEYFSGKRQEFEIEVAPAGTPFQLAVWKELLAIPFGETRSYLDIANAIGNPSATRAVGAANGANPISIVQPCHRVIGSNGSLTGFGGGLNAKAILLRLEGRLP